MAVVTVEAWTGMTMSRLWPQAAMLVTVPNRTLSRKARKEYKHIGETYHMQFEHSGTDLWW